MTLGNGDEFVVRAEKFKVVGQPDYALQYLDGRTKSTVIFLKVVEDKP